MPRRVLIVEDDHAIRSLLRLLFEDDGYEVREAADGVTALQAFESSSLDLVILDLRLPGMSGFDVCREIRKTSGVPIIIVSAQQDSHDIVAGLELGADDYVTKPFGPRELLARMHAAFRRADIAAVAPGATGAAAGGAASESFYFGPTLIDRRRFTATRDGTAQVLSAKELHLLEVFHRRKGEVLSRDTLLNEVWGIDYLGTTRTLDQHVAQVRKKVETDRAPQLIKTIHGVGYQYVG